LLAISGDSGVDFSHIEWVTLGRSFNMISTSRIAVAICMVGLVMQVAIPVKGSEGRFVTEEVTLPTANGLNERLLCKFDSALGRLYRYEGGEFVEIVRQNLPLLSERAVTVEERAELELQRKVLRRMDEIRLPEIDFRQSDIRDVVGFLSRQSADVGKLDGGAGLSFVLDLGVADDEPFAASPPAQDPFAAPPKVVDPFAMETTTSTHNAPRIITFSALDISLRESLDIICDLTRLNWRVRGGVILIAPPAYRLGDMISRAVPQAPRGVIAKLEKMQSSATHALGFDPIVGAAFKDWCLGQGLGNEYRPFDTPISCEVFPETGAMIIHGTPADVAWVGSFLAHVADAENMAPNHYQLRRLTDTPQLELLLVDNVGGHAWRYQPASRAKRSPAKFIYITTTGAP
jgi:hypothetical protein